MKKLLIIALLTIPLAVNMVSATESTRKIIKIDLTEQSASTIKEFFKLGVDVTHFNRVENYVTALVSEQEIQQISNLSLKTEVLLPDADAFVRQLRQTGYLENFHTYDQMLQEMQDIVANYPAIAKLEDIGDSYEKTVGKGGYDIWMLKISDNVDLEENESEVLFMANIHAREIITPEIIMYFMHYLVDNYGDDPHVTYLVNNRQIWLSPTINPDGHEYVFSGTSPTNYPNDPMWWRKNKRDNNNNGVFDPDYDGVDLNRNFGYMWGYDNSGSSPNSWSDTYRGSEPFSEPESQAIRDFVESHHFVVSLSFHSYGRWWLYPWGYDVMNPDTPDDAQFVALADSCVDYNRYIPGNGLTIGYPVNGDTDDWLYGEQTTKHKVFAYSPEVGNTSESIGGWTGFFPAPLYIDKQILENQGPMLYLAYAAGEEPIIESELYHDTNDRNGPYTIKAIIKPPIVLTQAIGLDSATFKLYYNTTGITSYDSTALVPTGNPDEYSGSIPGQGNDVIIYYYFSASDSLGRTGHAPRFAPAGLYSFTVGADTISPVIVHSPVSKRSVYATHYSIRATVTDNIGIGKVVLYYRQNGAALDSVEMKLTSITDQYETSINPDHVAIGDLFEYRIIAIDNSPNANQTIDPPTGFYSFNLINLFAFDFESDNGDFTTSSPSDWQWGTPTYGPVSAHSGNKLWGTKLNGDYSNLSNSWLDTPPIDLSGLRKCTFTFWHWYLFEYSDGKYWDGGNVKISMNGGPFELIYPVDGYDGVVDDYNRSLGGELAFGGPEITGNFWHQEYFDLTPYRDNVVVLRFHFGSDEYVAKAGWYIDDVQILLHAKYPPSISNTTVLPNTSDPVGPYVVQSKIIDDSDIASASIFFSIDADGIFSEAGMTDIGENIYQGEIPGKPYGTAVNYYVQAIDDSGYVTTEPADAPTTTYFFIVTDRLPEIFVSPINFDITIRQNENISDQ